MVRENRLSDFKRGHILIYNSIGMSLQTTVLNPDTFLWDGHIQFREEKWHRLSIANAKSQNFLRGGDILFLRVGMPPSRATPEINNVGHLLYQLKILYIIVSGRF